MKKRGPKSKLTATTQQRILDCIMAGSYDYQAAEAAGIDQSTFFRWMRQGEARDSEAAMRGEKLPADRYHTFYHAVIQARATARINAEQRVFNDDPFKWLRYGPGRDRPGRPGWSDQVAVTGEDSGPVELHITTEWGRNATKREENT